MNQALAEILSTKAAGFDAVQDARDLRAAIDILTSKTPALMAEVVSPRRIMQISKPEQPPADDSSVYR